MNRIIRNHFDKFFIAIVVMMLFSSDRNLLVTHYLLGGPKNSGLMTILFSAVSFIFLFYLFSIKGSLYIRHSQKKLIYFSIILASYFFVHEIVFSDGLTSIKYSIFITLMIFSLLVRHNAYFIFRVLGFLGGLISIIIISQQLLLLIFTNGDISNFEVVINGKEWARTVGCNYVAPYGLGFIERCAFGLEVSIFGFELNRSLFFSTEPKYISSVLLVTFSSLLISRKKSVPRSFLIYIHLLAFLFVGSASAILILFMSWLLMQIRLIGPFLYSSSVIIFPLFVLPFIFSFVVYITGIDGFLLNRLMSASSDIGLGGIQNISLFGQAFGACDKDLCEDLGLLGNLTETYGLLGLLLFWIFLYFLVVPMFVNIKNKNIDKERGVALIILINTYVVFNIYFFGDIFNMFSLIIILIILLLPEYISQNKPMISSINIVSDNKY